MSLQTISYDNCFYPADRSVGERLYRVANPDLNMGAKELAGMEPKITFTKEKLAQALVNESVKWKEKVNKEGGGGLPIEGEGEDLARYYTMVHLGTVQEKENKALLYGLLSLAAIVVVVITGVIFFPPIAPLAIIPTGTAVWCFIQNSKLEREFKMRVKDITDDIPRPTTN
jgi:hypothetical protein